MDKIMQLLEQLNALDIERTAARGDWMKKEQEISQQMRDLRGQAEMGLAVLMAPRKGKA